VRPTGAAPVRRQYVAPATAGLRQQGRQLAFQVSPLPRSADSSESTPVPRDAF
jgi:hypothetical protein